MNTLVTYKLQQHTNLHVNVMFWEIGDAILPADVKGSHSFDWQLLLLVQLHIRLTLTACNFCLKVGYIDLIFFFFLHVANIDIKGMFCALLSITK